MNPLKNQVMSDTRNRPLLFSHRKALCVLLFLVCAAQGCATVPHTGRRQFNLVSDRQLDSLGLQVFSEIKASEPESKDERLNTIVRRVVDRVSEAAETLDHPGFKWDVRLIDKESPNAFCLPGGKIVIQSGITQYAKNEAGLASIVAHEVAHAVARHGGERLSQQLALREALALGGEILKTKGGVLDQTSKMLLSALGLGATVGIVLPYSRVHEFEADRIGQLYMAKAGYDPSEAARVWDRMSKINTPPIPIWLSTHPADEERVRKLKESLPEAQKIYSDTPTKYGVGTPL
jgi:metalloendopeptidase OMA1, mitochondrial